MSHNPNCSCSQCQPPPCEPQEPGGCTPPESQATGIKIYIVDAEGCAKLLSAPTQNSVLCYDAESGLVEWRDGSTLRPVCLPALQEINVEPDDCVDSLMGFNEECLRKKNFVGVLDDLKIAVITPDGICFKGIEEIIPDGPGILYRAVEDGPFLFTPFPTDANTFLMWNGSSFEWITISEQTGEEVIFPSYKGLVLTNKIGSTYNATQITGTATAAILGNPAGNKVKFESVAISADISGSGAGGLDTGTVANDTWYYIWLISDGTAIAAMFSLSATAPTMPGSYTYKLLIGSVRNGTASFHSFYQTDNLTTYIAGNGIFSGDETDPQNGSSPVAVSMSDVVPPIATRWIGNVFMSNATDNNSGWLGLKLWPDGTGTNDVFEARCSPAITSSRPSVAGMTTPEIPLQVTQTGYWSTVVSAGTPAYDCSIRILGYRVP